VIRPTSSLAIARQAVVDLVTKESRPDVKWVRHARPEYGHRRVADWSGWFARAGEHLRWDVERGGRARPLDRNEGLRATGRNGGVGV